MPSLLVVAFLPLLATASRARVDPISAALSSIPFSNAISGVSRNADAYGTHLVSCYYLEASASLEACANAPTLTAPNALAGGKCHVHGVLLGRQV